MVESYLYPNVTQFDNISMASSSSSSSSSIFRLVVVLVMCFMINISSGSRVCIIGSGIGGSSVAHFLRKYSSSDESTAAEIVVFERNAVSGGRIATVEVSGEAFEAGASILHPKNLYALEYVHLLNLTIKPPSSSPSGFGVWNGDRFLFKTLSTDSQFSFVQKLVSYVNSVLVFLRYGVSLLRMDSFVQRTVGRFLKYYESHNIRPIFETVEEMLKWAGLYNLTTSTLEVELASAKLSPLLVQELVTVITRINYGQSVRISGLAGAVSLAGSGGGLWSIQGGNRQMASGILGRSNVTLHLNEEIVSVSSVGDCYQLNSSKGNSYDCDVAVVATPLDEVRIQFAPPVSIPERRLQHTHATFVRGLLNHEYFGLHSALEVPELVGTIEIADLAFTSISVLKHHNKNDNTYKIFSRKPMDDELLDTIFSTRNETMRIDWGAYPHYNAPEVFAPFILDGKHLYYVNAFENAASTMETSAVSAENIARLILSRFFAQPLPSFTSHNLGSHSPTGDLHVDL